MPTDATGPKKIERKLAAILAADVVGYSRLMGADEEDTFARLKEHRRELIDPKVVEHFGRVVKLTGDGALIEFPSVVEAVRCAVKIQQAMADRNAQIAPEKRIEIRIGINLGDVIVDDGDIYGDGVNIAARLESIAEPGGICISARVLDEIRSKVDLAFEDLGERQLKNIGHPVRAFHVRRREAVAFSGQSSGAQPLALPDKPSIAVLPFSNMSVDPEQEFFSDGIAEDVLTALSKLRWLFIIARNSSFSYKGKSIDIKQVGRELGVRYVLDGSVRRAGARVRVSVHLIDAISGMHIWANRYDRELEDIFAVQEEITEAVATAIGPAIIEADRQRAVRQRPENLSAWEAYQRGLWHMSRHDAAENQAARTYFQRATELDPNFAPAYTALSRTYAIGASVFSEMSLAEGTRLGEPLARTAVILDENEADARAALANMIWLRGDHESALNEAQQALSINENCANAFGVKGGILVFSGRRDEGRAAISQYLALSPRDPARPIRLAQIAASHYLDGEYENAVLTSRQVVRQYPENALAYRWLAASLGQLDRETEANQVLQSLMTLAPASLELWTRHQPAYFRHVDHEHMLEGLRKAGWQE